MIMVKDMNIQISGMRCGGCASGVERSVQRQVGVNKVSVDVVSKIAQVSFDDNQIKIDQIKAAIEKLGYVVEGYYEKN
jgi:copper chaperone CopZ